MAGQVHEAARRCLGPGQGELEREAFEELFPWRTGWASAVLTEGLLVPAGSGYRFAHEEFADWVQGSHLDLDAALYALVHRWYEPAGPPAEAAVRLPSRTGGKGPLPTPGGHVPPPPGSGAARGGAKGRRKRGGGPAEPPRPLPVPRHRIGPVLQAMLLLARRSGPTELSRRLSALVHAIETLSQRAAEAEAKEEGAGRRLGDPAWWAAHLLGETCCASPTPRRTWASSASSPSASPPAPWPSAASTARPGARWAASRSSAPGSGSGCRSASPTAWSSSAS